jgi:hypothetical protein
LACIWKAPTSLKGKSLCALAVLLNPNGAEVYVVPLYSFWFAGLLVALALLWDKDAQSVTQRFLRSAFILIGGLSSPLVVPLAPLFLLRAIRFGRAELPFALQAGLVALVQTVATITTGASTSVAGN